MTMLILNIIAVVLFVAGWFYGVRQFNAFGYHVAKRKLELIAAAFVAVSVLVAWIQKDSAPTSPRVWLLMTGVSWGLFELMALVQRKRKNR